MLNLVTDFAKPTTRQQGISMDHLFLLTVQDAQNVASKRIGRGLTAEELEDVRNGIELGLENWYEVLETAIDEAVKRK